MEYNNDPALLRANEAISARLSAQNELISELKATNEFLRKVIETLVVYGQNSSK